MIDEALLTKVERGQGYVYGVLAAKPDHLSYMKKGTNVGIFEGVNEFIEFLRKRMPTPRRAGISYHTDPDYHFFHTYAEALDTFEHDPQKITKFDPAELEIKDYRESGTEVEFEVVGDFIDMGRVIEGVPEDMGQMHNGDARNRRATVIISGNNGADMSTSEINHRSERIVRLVDALEANGVRTEVTVIHSSDISHTEVKIKHHDEPLTITDLAVACHSDYQRRLGWRFKEYGSLWEHGYGKPYLFMRYITPALIETDNNDEITLFIGSNMNYHIIDNRFDQVEKILEWELSKPIPEISSITATNDAFGFHGNGSRPERELVREGREAVRGRQ